MIVRSKCLAKIVTLLDNLLDTHLFTQFNFHLLLSSMLVAVKSCKSTAFVVVLVICLFSHCLYTF